jgi:hypothetical protein
MESLLALFRFAAVKLTSKEESFVVGLFWWDENQDSRYSQLEGREELFERVSEAPN